MKLKRTAAKATLVGAMSIAAAGLERRRTGQSGTCGT
jgi:hypothetical protein